MSEQSESKNLVKFTGTEVGYYFICRKKLWWFNHGIRDGAGTRPRENGQTRSRKQLRAQEKGDFD